MTPLWRQGRACSIQPLQPLLTTPLSLLACPFGPPAMIVGNACRHKKAGEWSEQACPHRPHLKLEAAPAGRSQLQARVALLPLCSGEWASALCGFDSCVRSCHFGGRGLPGSQKARGCLPGGSAADWPPSLSLMCSEIDSSDSAAATLTMRAFVDCSSSDAGGSCCSCCCCSQCPCCCCQCRCCKFC